MYMLLPLHVLYSKIEMNIILFILRDLAGFRTLVEDLLVCGVLSSSHHGTPHTRGAKRFNLGSFYPRVCVSHILKIL